jgi:peptidoglycan/xylan/chitin deacetylase (PgdA/CDA1 family)
MNSILTPMLRLLPRYGRPAIMILCFHRIAQPGVTWMTEFPDVEALRWRVKALASLVPILDLKTALDSLFAGTLDGPVGAITFDDGYLDNLELAAPVLNDLGVNATFFVCSGYLGSNGLSGERLRQAFGSTDRGVVDLREFGLERLSFLGLEERKAVFLKVREYVKYLNWKQRDAATDLIVNQLGSPDDGSQMMQVNDLRELVAQGMAVGSHSHNHLIPTRCTPNEFLADIRKSKETIQGIIGKETELFAFPNGKIGKDYSAQHSQLVSDAGFKFALTTDVKVSRQNLNQFAIPRYTPWDNNQLRFKLRVIEGFAFN